MPEIETLNPEPEPAKSFDIDPLATDFLMVYQEHQTTYSSELQEKESLERKRDKVADTDNPTTSNKRTNSSLAHKTTYNLLKQLDIPAFKIICGQMSETQRNITQSLFEDFLEKAGWRRVLTNKKNGAQQEYISTGDSVIGFGANLGKFPFTYWNVDYQRMGVNPDANQFVNPGSEREVRKFVTIKEYSDSQLFSQFPELKGQVTVGALPTISADGQLDHKTTEMQKQLVIQKRTQVAYCYDLDFIAKDGTRGLFMEIVGQNLFVKKRQEGNQYPHRDRDGDVEMPYDGLVCFARQRGFVNYGILQIVYKLGEMHKTLTNMGITYTLSNSNPVRIVSTNQTETEFAANFNRAQRNAKDGKVPIMVNKDGKEFGGVTTLQTNAIINELNGILDILEKDLAQFGINLNDITTDTTKTLGALQLEVAASTAFVQYVQKENAPSYKRLIQMSIQSLKERKKDDSDIALVSNAKIRNGEGEIVEAGGVPEVDEGGEIVTKGNQPKIARGFTLEDLKQMFIKFECDVEVVGGVQNNPVLEDQLLRDIVATSDPTSKASVMARGQRARKMGFNFEDEDFAPGSGVQQPEQAGQAVASPAIPSEAVI